MLAIVLVLMCLYSKVTKCYVSTIFLKVLTIMKDLYIYRCINANGSYVSNSAIPLVYYIPGSCLTVTWVEKNTLFSSGSTVLGR